MSTYEAYKNKEFDLAAFGLDRCGGDYTYFCTPVGADVFASPGVDGIHYCMIEGFGELVFAISPMNCPGEYVHPVARSFDDFLRLLLVCDGDAAIEQCWQWSQKQFDQFMGEQEVLPETKKAAMHLMELTGLEPAELPYKYIRDLQKSFNYKSIPFSEEYYETVSPEDLEQAEEILCEQPATPWAVYYGDNFWASHHEDEPCEEISLEKHFQWAGRDWYIPSVYICEKGVVADILMRVESERFCAFMDKWGVTLENEHTFSKEQRRQMELENPLGFHFRSDLHINGKVFRSNRGCSTAYAPIRSEIDRLEWEPILDYYNLDRASCWVIQRSCYPWIDGQPMEIVPLEVTMKHQPMFVPGETFETRVTGEVHTFQNPTTGTAHTLTVQEFEAKEMDIKFPGLKDREYPSHHIAMTFTLEPELSQTEFSITDSLQSDEPRVIPGYTSESKSKEAEAIGIIGGADGPTAIIMGTPKSKGQLHAAVSRFCFEPFDTVRWQLSFKEKQIKEKTVELM
jgi:hypothetical protein